MKTPRFVWDWFSSHQPILYEALRRTSGMVVDFGCGEGSTELLHELCKPTERHLITFDNDMKYLSRYEHLKTSWHEIIFVEDWVTLLLTHEEKPWLNCDVALVDQMPWEARTLTVQVIKDHAKFVLVHDVDYFPGHGIFGYNRDPIDGAKHIGLRTYEDTFKYWKEFFPLEPWPYEPSGPPTLLGSNFLECDWDVDYEKYVENELLIRLGEERD